MALFPKDINLGLCYTHILVLEISQLADFVAKFFNIQPSIYLFSRLVGFSPKASV